MSDKTLALIDSEAQQRLRGAYEGNTAFSLSLLFALGFGFTPFLLMTFLFIPVLGQLLVAVGLLSTLYYFRLKRSWAALLSWICGAGLALCCAVMAGKYLRSRLDLALFGLLALGLPLSIAYVMIVGWLIWSFVNRVNQTP